MLESLLCAIIGLLVSCQDGAPAVAPTPAPTATAQPAAPSTATEAPTATPAPQSPAPAATPAPVARPLRLPPPAQQGEITVGPPSAIARGYVAFTFDAGISSPHTVRILDQLKAAGVRSTMFVTGEWIDANPALARRLLADGHEISNHSYSHPDFTRITSPAVALEIRRMDDAVRRITGGSSKPWLRPPFGARDARVNRAIADEGYYNVYWSLDSLDWQPVSNEVVLSRVAQRTTAGSIIVSHLTSPQTASVLTQQIAALRARGFTLVTLSEMFSTD